jgi:hypothetical protein
VYRVVPVEEAWAQTCQLMCGSTPIELGVLAKVDLADQGLAVQSASAVGGQDGCPVDLPSGPDHLVSDQAANLDETLDHENRSADLGQVVEIPIPLAEVLGQESSAMAAVDWQAAASVSKDCRPEN